MINKPKSPLFAAMIKINRQFWVWLPKVRRKWLSREGRREAGRSWDGFFPGLISYSLK
jgi:hypothetical protein